MLSKAWLLLGIIVLAGHGCVRLVVDAPRDAQVVSTDAVRFDRDRDSAADSRPDGSADGRSTDSTPDSSTPDNLLGGDVARDSQVASNDVARFDRDRDSAADSRPDGPADGLSTDSTRDGPTPDYQPGDGGGVPGTWVTIAKGSFTMGSPTGEPCQDSNETPHPVTLTYDFEIQTTEVTQGQFLALMRYDPASKPCSPSASCPVETVSWHESAAYCNALSQRAGKAACYTCSGGGASVTCQEAAAYSGPQVYDCPGYRLPTEAEWEYAYRAGTTTAYHSGANDKTACWSCLKADANGDMIGWYCANAADTKHPVGQKQMNAWGLYDMAGNVWEWCHDWYQVDLGSAAATNPWGSAAGPNRVARGGAWGISAGFMRAATRFGTTPSIRGDHIGFRCCRTATP